MGLFNRGKKTIELQAICQGEVKDIIEASDATIAMVFPTKHAMGLKLKDGSELLLHFGIDTVNLNGEGFTVCVKEGDQIKAGDALWHADLAYIKEHAPSEAMMIVVTSLADGKTLKKVLGNKKTGEKFLEIR
ncbi:PTS sugar transporter subunit IIA [[Eubacterium] hominis]|uniref:PTS glucose transporter subunit IIA n=1 Tax=[Eubacterium] hominis TaxID=2764325 RepID=A0A7G9GLI6_9FIRM|nr:PTS glucose transporter subunit IIA [[Eubacterium] hominis]